jgi:protoporphyrin/coproporphyrin ferrochelatase
MNSNTAVLLVNLGSPDSPRPGDVYRYLTEFLNDPRVIDLPWLGRKLLVNGIIVPFRHRKSAKVYEKLWTPEGSPLITWGRKVQALLQGRLGPEAKVYLAMRYQNPSMTSVLEEIREANHDHVIVLPLFPQYAGASTGSVIDRLFEIIRPWHAFPELSIINQFYDDAGYMNALVATARDINHSDYDHILFSYHGLPERQVDKLYKDRKCRNHSCENEINEENRFCYKAHCYATTRMLAERLGIAPDRYTVCFQSRLGKGWIEPFSDDVIADRAVKGDKKLLVFSPAFVADCLETTIEIGEEYDEMFKHAGGDSVTLVPSLNDRPEWIDALETMVRRRMK